MMSRIQKDLQEYQNLEREFEEMARQEDLHNLEVLRAVEGFQDGRDDNANELLQFANQQLNKLDLEQQE